MPNIYRRKDTYYYKILAPYAKAGYDDNPSEYKEHPTFRDIPESMFEIMMSLLIGFVEEESIERIDWKHNETHRHVKDEFMKIYKFAKTYSKYLQSIENKYLTVDWKSNDEGLWFIYEDKLCQLEDQMMKRLIDIRQYLWT